MTSAGNSPNREEETLEVGVDESTYVQLEATAARNDESTEEAAEAVLRRAGHGLTPSTPTSLRYDLFGLAVSAAAFWTVGLAWIANKQGIPLVSEAMIPTVGSLLPIALVLSGAVGVVCVVAFTVGLPTHTNH